MSEADWLPLCAGAAHGANATRGANATDEVRRPHRGVPTEADVPTELLDRQARRA